jgi:hypothetical protein
MNSQAFFDQCVSDVLTIASQQSALPSMIAFAGGDAGIGTATAPLR